MGEIESGREREIASLNGFDADGVMIHPLRHVIEAVAFEGPRRPTCYFLWDRIERRATFLFSDHPEFEALELAQLSRMRCSARDGMELHVYLATPAGLPA